MEQADISRQQGEVFYLDGNTYKILYQVLPQPGALCAELRAWVPS